MKRKLTLRTMLAAALMVVGMNSAWATAVPYTVGTEGTGDEWASRKYSDAYEIAPGEIYHFAFTNTSYGTSNWNNWLLDCTDAALVDGKPADGTTTWYFTMRSDNHGWGTSYNGTMRYADFVWDNFRTVMNGATVDMYVDYNSTDKIIRTYTTITSSDATTTWRYNFASKAIDQSSVQLFLSEELAVLNITTAEKVASLPDGTYGIYKRSITDGYGYTWDINTENPDYTGWSVETAGTKTLDLTDGLKTVIGNSSGSLKTTVTSKVGSIINVDATFFLYGVASGTNVAFFRFGNIYIINDGVECQSRYLLNGSYSNENKGISFHSTTKASTSIYRTTGITYRLQLEVNTITNKVTSMKVYVNNVAEPSLNISDQVLSSYDYSTIEFGYIKYTRSNSNTTCKLSEITITETPQTISTVNYTVKFQDALGNTLKDDVVHDNGVVGEVYQATSDDMATFFNNADEAEATKKYIYKSGQNTSVNATATASENVITLVFDVFDKTAYTVKAQAGGSDLTTLTSGSAYFDGSTTAYWSKYVNVADQWYVADDDTYGQIIAAATANVAYTTTSAIDYFFEAESMTGSSSYGTQSNNTSYSGGAGYGVYQGATLTAKTTIPSGTYTIGIGSVTRTASKDQTYTISYSTDGESFMDTGKSISFQTAAGSSEQSVAEVNIPAAAYIRLTNSIGNNAYDYVDYVYAKRTSNASVSATLGANGYATFASAYPLDLTTANLPSGVTAYKAAVSGTTVTFTPLDQTVPANTGVLLKGLEDAEVSIPVVASGTDVTENAFLVNTAGTKFDAEAGYTYFGMKKAASSSDAITFATFAPATVAIPASKAYLKVLTSSITSAPSLTFIFDDGQTTGIESVKAEGLMLNGSAEYYNLAGQRVAQPTKGLYIVNGRKVVVK